MSQTSVRTLSTPLLSLSLPAGIPPFVNTPAATAIQALIRQSFYVFPADYYPLRGVNQILLRWYLETMPTGATYVQLTPVTVEGFKTTTGNQMFPGFFNTTPTFVTAGVKWTWDNLDTINSRVNLYPYSLYKTAADATFSIATPASTTLIGGTRHALPIAEDYVVFLLETDGTDATGQQSLFADVRYA